VAHDPASPPPGRRAALRRPVARRTTAWDDRAGERKSSPWLNGDRGLAARTVSGAVNALPLRLREAERRERLPATPAQLAGGDRAPARVSTEWDVSRRGAGRESPMKITELKVFLVNPGAVSYGTDLARTDLRQVVHRRRH
jgi:hypothetical protein